MPRLGFVAVLVVLVLSACKAAVPPWGNTLESARRNADNTLAAFAFRFYNVHRDPKFAAARSRMARFALIPSKIFGDTSVWTSAEGDSSRSLSLSARFLDNQYLFSARAPAPLPEHVGDERHTMQLRTLGDQRYEWLTEVDHGIGPVRAEQVANFFGVLFTAFESAREGDLREDARTTFAHTARHLGQIFSLDSLRATPQADGSTSLVMRVSFIPDTLRLKYPYYAAYIDKYIVPSELHLQITDRAGAPYFDFALREASFFVRLRSRKGTLVPLTGLGRPMPDSLLIRLDARAKFMIFHVGFSDLIGDFIVDRSEHDRAWVMRFRREPNWHLPLAADKLIKSPLKSPFEGRGTELRLGVRDDMGGQTMSQRMARTVVKESAIMRFFGGLGSSAFGDFAGRSETEENRFLSELFGTLRQDFAAVAR